MKRLLILGAGTAGTMVAANLRPRLDNDEWKITMIDQEPTHYYQPGFLFIPFGIYSPSDVVKPKADFVPAGVGYIEAEIELIEAAENRVTLAAVLRENMPDYQEFWRRLKAAGAPSTASDLGLTADKTRTTILAARYIRDRYGILDYLFELGILEEVAELISTRV